MARRPITALAFGTLACAIGTTVAFWTPAEVSLEAVTEANPFTLGAVYAAPAEQVDTYVLDRGQTLGGLLSAASPGGIDLTRLIGAIGEHKDPRRMAIGTRVVVRRWAETLETRAVDLELNRDSTLRLEPAEEGGWAGEIIETPVTLDTVHVAGEIGPGQSLYSSILTLESPSVPAPDRIDLVLTLAGIYEYKVDFFHDLQAGDRYRFAYERESRPDGTARSHRVLVAELDNRGRALSAFRFKDDGSATYFDAEGRSLKGAFSRYPLDVRRVTSNFSWRRYHPVLGIYRAHVGTDFGAPSGTPVRATADGVVDFAGRRGGYGNLIVLRHRAGYTTRYAHLRGFASGVRSGRRVTQGEVIGYVGATGTATGPHLHYEFRKNGDPVDALRVELPSAAPVSPERREEFDRVVASGTRLLNGIQPPAPRLAGSKAEEEVPARSL